MQKGWTIQEELLPDLGHCRAVKPGLKAQLQPRHLPACQRTTTNMLGDIDVLKEEMCSQWYKVYSGWSEKIQNDVAWPSFAVAKF